MTDIDKLVSNMDAQRREQIYEAVKARQAGGYHSLYLRYGMERPKKTTGQWGWSCPNPHAHKNGDANPSFSINDGNGLFKCFGCGYKGNFFEYYRDYGSSRTGKSYLAEMLPQLGLEWMLTAEDRKVAAEFEEARMILEKWRIDNSGVGDGEDFAPLDIESYNKFVEHLLETPAMLDFLYKKRKITPEVIEKYRIGLTLDNKNVLFPFFDAQQNLMRWKCYQPNTTNPIFKWYYPKSHNGRPMMPSPLVNLTGNKIYLFEGEPDTYCAIGFGLNAATGGSAASVNVFKNALGTQFEQTFRNKEIVICTDDDDAGAIAGRALAHALYPYASQIKILNLRQRDELPTGLDDKLMKNVGTEEKPNLKRVEKDFTDFMTKNGFGDVAKQVFLEIESRTEVYTENVDRGAKETIKVSIDEAMQGRYYNPYGLKELEVMAVTQETESAPYQLPVTIAIQCNACDGVDSEHPFCKHCMVREMLNERGTGACMRVSFELVDGSMDTKLKSLGTNHYKKVLRAEEYLNLIEISSSEMAKNLAKMFRIPRGCLSYESFAEKKIPVMKATMVKDVNDYESSADDIVNKEAQMVVYTINTMPIANNAYRLRGVLSSHHRDQGTVFLATSCQPVEAAATSFKMNADMHEVLKRFQPREFTDEKGVVVTETVSERIYRMSDAFGGACGLVGRVDLVVSNMLAFFSQATVTCPAITGNSDAIRGFVELAIIGETRTGKTTVSIFMLKHYKIGDKVSGGTQTSYAGLLGGFNPKTNGLVWGKIPMCDKSILVLDEVQQLPHKMMQDLNEVRTSGEASITKAMGKQVCSAMTRKIWVSNTKDDANKSSASANTEFGSGGGFLAMKGVYGHDAVMSRFDMAIMLSSFDKVTPKYAALTSEYNEFACQAHLRWTYSRRPDQIIYTKKFVEAIFASSDRIQSVYHKSTFLVTAEMPVKLLRLSLAVAALTYSIGPNNNWEQIMPLPEHVLFVEEFLNKLYSQPDFDLVALSRNIEMANKLQDMTFLTNVLKYVGCNQFFLQQNFTKDTLKSIFADYLIRVSQGLMKVPDSMTDDRMQTGLYVNDAFEKLLNALCVRNFLKRAQYGFMLSHVGLQWLRRFVDDKSDDKYSDMLETTLAKRDNEAEPVKVMVKPAVKQLVAETIEC